MPVSVPLARPMARLVGSNPRLHTPVSKAQSQPRPPSLNQASELSKLGIYMRSPTTKSLVSVSAHTQVKRTKTNFATLVPRVPFNRQVRTKKHRRNLNELQRAGCAKGERRRARYGPGVICSAHSYVSAGSAFLLLFQSSERAHLPNNSKIFSLPPPVGGVF